MRKLRFTSTIITLTTLVFAIGFTPLQSYGDVINDMDNHWAKNYVAQVVESEIAKGYPDGTFKPDGAISIAEFTTMLINQQGYEQGEAGDMWYDAFLNTAEDNRIIMDGEIADPEVNITRAEMARMISRAAKLNEIEGSHFADDALLDSTFGKHIYAVADAEIIKGFPDGSFKPENEATRAEACVMISNLIDYQAQSEVIEEVEEYVPLTETLGVWSRAEYDAFDKLNLHDENFKSIDGLVKEMYEYEHIFTHEELEYIAKPIEDTMVALSWYATQKGHRVDMDADSAGIDINYYSSPTEEEVIFTIRFIPKKQVTNKIEVLDYEFGFLLKRLYAYGEIAEYGGDDAFMQYSKENNHTFPVYETAVEIATDVIYQEDGAYVADLLINEIGNIEYSFDNVVEKRLIRLTHGEYLLESNKEAGEVGFSYVGLWAEHDSVFGDD